jgi:hypothetical protein
LHRPLKKIEGNRSLKESLLRESSTGAREILMARINAISESHEAARARGEEVPTADPEDVKAWLRNHFGWSNKSLQPATASMTRG